LLELLLVDTLRSELAKNEIVLHGDWREVLRSFAVAIRESLVQTGEFYDYVRMSAAIGLLTMAWVEQVAETLIDAGFDEQTAGHAVGFVAELTYVSARDAVLVARYGEHPQIRNCDHCSSASRRRSCRSCADGWPGRTPAAASSSHSTSTSSSRPRTATRPVDGGSGGYGVGIPDRSPHPALRHSGGPVRPRARTDHLRSHNGQTISSPSPSTALRRHRSGGPSGSGR